MGTTRHISDYWRSKSYEGVRSHTNMEHPPLLQEVGQSAFRACMVARLRRVVGDRRFRRALDLGCGTGDWSVDYLAFAGEVVAVDINPAFVEVGRRRAAALPDPERISFHAMDLLAFEDYREPDFIGLGAVLSCLGDAECVRFLERVCGSLVPGGILYVRATVANRWRGRYGTDLGVYRTRAEYEALFQRFGLEVLDAATSAEVAAHEVLAEAAGLRREGLADRALQRLLRGAIAARHAVDRSNDFLNWVLRLAR